jgi:nitronate monooxygenase
MILDEIPVPIVQAPLAGGPSTPALAAAVCNAGGLGFVAAGYRAPAAMTDDIAATRAMTSRPFGVNVFASAGERADAARVRAYAEVLQGEARRLGATLGEPRFDDDSFSEKVEILIRDPVPVVSFTFGCPSREVIADLRGAGSEVWVTVTDPEEAETAKERGAGVLVVQGTEAGGHRGSFSDRLDAPDFSVLALLQLVRARTGMPMVAAGGIATGDAVAAVLSAGASAAQIGTAFLRSPEAGTSAVHRAALASPRPTALTRVFSGRLARGIVNRMMRDYEPQAPIAYPEVHHLTSPLRVKGRETGDEDVVNLWAGQTHELAEEMGAGEIVARLHRDALEALDRARTRLRHPETPG